MATVYSSETFTSDIRELMKGGHDEGHNKFNPENHRMFSSVCFLLKAEPLDFMKEH